MFSVDYFKDKTRESFFCASFYGRWDFVIIPKDECGGCATVEPLLSTKFSPMSGLSSSDTAVNSESGKCQPLLETSYLIGLLVH